MKKVPALKQSTLEDIDEMFKRHFCCAKPMLEHPCVVRPGAPCPTTVFLCEMCGRTITVYHNGRVISE